MMKSSMRLFAMAMASLMLLGTFVATASAQGNSEAAHLCQDGGYLNYTDADRNGFKNTGQCVSYAARGGELVPVVVTDLDFDGNTITGTGFTPNTALTVLVVHFSPSGAVQNILSYESVTTDASGAFTTSGGYRYCYLGDEGVEITATDAAGVSHTETFALSCGV